MQIQFQQANNVKLHEQLTNSQSPDLSTNRDAQMRLMSRTEELAFLDQFIDYSACEPLSYVENYSFIGDLNQTRNHLKENDDFNQLKEIRQYLKKIQRGVPSIRECKKFQMHLKRFSIINNCTDVTLKPLEYMAFKSFTYGKPSEKCKKPAEFVFDINKDHKLYKRDPVEAQKCDVQDSVQELSFVKYESSANGNNREGRQRLGLTHKSRKESPTSNNQFRNCAIGEWRYNSEIRFPDMTKFRTPNQYKNVNEFPQYLKDNRFIYLQSRKSGLSKYEPFIVRSLIINKGRNSEGLCPYCPEPTFYRMNDSSYLHHITLLHGIFSNGMVMPTPRGGEMHAKTKKRGTLVHQYGLICPYKNCRDKFIRLKNLCSSARDDNSFRIFWRHCTYQHKNGKKMDAVELELDEEAIEANR